MRGSILLVGALLVACSSAPHEIGDGDRPDAAGNARAAIPSSGGAGTGGASATGGLSNGASSDAGDSQAGGAPGDAGTGGDPGAGGSGAGGDVVGNGGAGTGGAPNSKACDPPSVGGPYGGGQDCGQVCGWTLQTRPFGYNSSTPHPCRNYESCAEDPSPARDITFEFDHSFVLPAAPHQRLLDGIAHNCPPVRYCEDRTKDLRFVVHNGVCARFTSSSPVERRFSTNLYGTCEHSSCLVAVGPRVLGETPTDVWLISDPYSEAAWVRYEAARVDSDNTCPLTCPP